MVVDSTAATKANIRERVKDAPRRSSPCHFLALTQLGLLVKHRAIWCNPPGECQILQTPLAALIKMDARVKAKMRKM